MYLLFSREDNASLVVSTFAIYFLVFLLNNIVLVFPRSFVCMFLFTFICLICVSLHEHALVDRPCEFGILVKECFLLLAH